MSSLKDLHADVMDQWYTVELARELAAAASGLDVHSEPDELAQVCR